MISIDHAAAIAPYEQVRRGISASIDAGELRPGDRLPTVRRLAADLGLAVNTVARAYRELEAAAIIETRGRAGSFVSDDTNSRELRRAAADYVARVRALGADHETALDLVRGLAVGS